MQLFSTNTKDMGPLMAKLGLYFQIRDDYANLNLKEVGEFVLSIPLEHIVLNTRLLYTYSTLKIKVSVKT